MIEQKLMIGDLNVIFIAASKLTVLSLVIRFIYHLILMTDQTNYLNVFLHWLALCCTFENIKNHNS